MLKIAAAVSKQLQGLASPTITQKYKLEGTIASGSTAHVKRATDRKTGQVVAMKIIDLATFKKRHKIEREIDIMLLIDHPNCVKLYDMCKTSGKIYLAMEFMGGGELFSRIMMKIIGAVAYLHAMGIVHRDLKPENILYVSEAEDSPVKIADFGFGRIIDYEGDMMRTICGTPNFIAPEIIAGECRQGARAPAYGPACDVWSAGVILYCMLSGEYPFSDDLGLAEMFSRISAGIYWFPPRVWGDVSPEAKDLVRAMMTVDVRRRVAAADCLGHPWFARCREGGFADAPELTHAQAKLRDRHEALAKRKLLGVGAAAAAAAAAAAGAPAPCGGTAGCSNAAGAAAAAAAAAATPVGCLLARGEGLEIVSINGYARQLLACAADPAPAPRAVRDVLDPAFADAHGQFLARAVREGRLPASIQHPLRSVPLRRRDGTTTQVELLVGALDEHAALGNDTLFFAYFVPSVAAAAAAARGGHRPGGVLGGDGGGSGGGGVGREPSLRERMEARYGHGFTALLLRGLAAPPPDEYGEATVASFTLPADAAAGGGEALWQLASGDGGGGSGAGGALDLAGIAARHRIHVMDGGDGGGCGARVVCVAGTNHVRGDLSFDQAERMVNFLAEVVAALGDRHIRVGVATGPVSVSVDLFRPLTGPGAASAGGDAGCGDGAGAAALGYQASGAAAEEAARLEATGREGFLHLSLAAADRLGEERGLFLDLGDLVPDGPGSPSSLGSAGSSFPSGESAGGGRRGSTDAGAAATGSARRRCSLQAGATAGFGLHRPGSSPGAPLPRTGSLSPTPRPPARGAGLAGGSWDPTRPRPFPRTGSCGSRRGSAPAVSVWIDCFQPNEVFLTDDSVDDPADGEAADSDGPGDA